MPPKATEKKLLAKKAAAFVQKELDINKYFRKVICVDEISYCVAALSILLL